MVPEHIHVLIPGTVNAALHGEGTLQMKFS
jgi:hypothetical protein